MLINEGADTTVSAIFWPTDLKEQKKNGGAPDLFIPEVWVDLEVVSMGKKATAKGILRRIKNNHIFFSDFCYSNENGSTFS